MNLLIIEDDYYLSKKIKEIFKNNNPVNIIDLAFNYNDFLDKLYNIKSYDIILVDINLWDDKKNGFDIIKIVRKKNINIPIIVISWNNSLEFIDYSFSIWWNDYMIKPFRIKELQIRASNWVKTYFLYWNIIDNNKINYFGLIYNLNENEFYFNNTKIILSRKIKYLLIIFISNKEKFISIEFLICKLWWDINLYENKNIRVNIFRLKKILETIWIDNWIKNIRWEWYIFKKI